MLCCISLSHVVFYMLSFKYTYEILLSPYCKVSREEEKTLNVKSV